MEENKHLCQKCGYSFSFHKGTLKKEFCPYCERFTPQRVKAQLSAMKRLVKRAENIPELLPTANLRKMVQWQSAYRMNQRSATDRILRKHRIPFSRIVRQSLLFNENTLSDMLFQLFNENSGYILRLLLKEMGLRIDDSMSLTFLSRETLTAVGEGHNRADISVEFRSKSSCVRLVIEHKIRHNLSMQQIRRYHELDTKFDCFILLSSSDSDWDVVKKFVENHSRPCSIRRISHFDLLHLLCSRRLITQMNSYGFLLRWLAGISLYYAAEENCHSKMYRLGFEKGNPIINEDDIILSLLGGTN